MRENGGQYTHARHLDRHGLRGAWATAKRAWELFTLINPVTHGDTAEAIAVYRVEPYVVAADVYAVPPHTGRGGWTWYTGSAGWMYRLITESLLGLRLEVDKLRFAPCLPAGLDVVQDSLPLSRNLLPHHPSQQRHRHDGEADSPRRQRTARKMAAADRRPQRSSCRG